MKSLSTEADLACDLAHDEFWLANNVKRKCAYRVFTILVHGYLGKGVRKMVPLCAMKGIRAHYPRKTYMVHKDY